VNIRFLFLLPGLALAACHSTHDDDYYDKQPHATTTPSGGSTTKSTTNASMSVAATADDRDFVTKAAQGGVFEVKSSELALTKSGISPEMRSFAQMMVDDHGKANKELTDLARKKSITASTMLDSKHQAQLDELTALDGDAFDRAYREAQIKAHDGAIELFEKAAKDCDDADLKSFAQRTLPTLKTHRSKLGS
jgi:putative membrane protein